jgi:hypothetical protein
VIEKQDDAADFLAVCIEHSSFGGYRAWRTGRWRRRLVYVEAHCCASAAALRVNLRGTRLGG